MEVILCCEAVVVAEGDVSDHIFPFVAELRRSLMLDDIVVGVRNLSIFLEELFLDVGGFGDHMAGHLVCESLIFDFTPFFFGE